MPDKAVYLDALDKDKGASPDASLVFAVQNRALRAAIACPLPFRTAKDCVGCGNAECYEAYEAQRKLWPELPSWGEWRPEPPVRKMPDYGAVRGVARKEKKAERDLFNMEKESAA